jgi:galactitol-specific phosphotransferase system IIB component
MQNLQHPYEEIFGEIKILLAELSDSDSFENLLTKENQLNQLYQKFSFLKISNEFGFSSTEFEPLEVIENQETNIDSNLISVEEFEDENKVAEIIVEEIEIHDIFDDVPEVEEVHSFKEIDEQEHSQENVVEEVFNFAEIESEESQVEEGIHAQENQVVENESVEEVSNFAEIDSEENNAEKKIETEENEFVSEIEENLLQDSSQKLEPMQDSQFSFAMNREETQASKDDDYEARLAEKEAKLKELEENRRKIVEFSKNNTVSQEKPKQDSESVHDEHPDKKFKLANIKGLKVAKSLFDDDHLEDVEQHQPKQESGSLLKNNVPTDYMEAPKPKPEFKLDLNDRIAFSQHLFDGSQSELNQVVAVLNSFTSLDKAQEFLSDIYYERDWKKVDNYAQRLWTLVENRFL